MNIAIVIGASHYQNLQELPGSNKDAIIFYNILTKSSKYEEILLLTEDTTSQNVKQKVIEFTQKYKNNDIEEFIIYFSGHGSFDGKEFYYLCSDYDNTKLKQTSFENKELDNYIKLLNPTLTVKIVDSCESGVHYIKDNNNFNDYLKKNQQNFNNCYFLYSSQNNQSSYADDKLSFFTKVLIESIINIQTENIRYKDIIDYISDSFSTNDDQKPLFITQAEFTEKFIHINMKEKENLKQELEEVITKTETIKSNEKSLLELVQKDSRNYLEKEKIIIILEEIKNKINVFDFKKDDNFLDLYDISTFFNTDYNHIPNIKHIAKWIDKNNTDFFVETIYETKRVTKKVPKKTGIMGIGLALSGEIEYKSVTEDISYPANVKSTTDLDYNHIFIKTKPKYPNLYSTGYTLIPFISKTKLLFFKSYITYKNIGWNDEKVNYDKMKWSQIQLDLCDVDKIYQLIDDSLNEFIDFTIEETKKALNLDEMLNKSLEEEQVKTLDKSSV